MSDFRVSSTRGEIEGVTFYFVESTAPDSVEQRAAAGAPPKGLTPIDDAAEAVRRIAAELVPDDQPDIDANLVVMIHGFNNPRDRVLKFYAQAVEALKANQQTLFSDKKRKIVCVGYRWPSEAMFSVILSSFSALPLFPSWLFWPSAVIIGLRLLDRFIALPANLAELVLFATPAAGIVAAIVLVAALLRAIVYFRDNFRANNYGVPDLVEVIRQIDYEASKRIDELREAKARPRIALSFIGHSMGGMVVTNAIRVLCDVFDPAVIRTDLSGALKGPAAMAAEGEDRVPGKIGHVFTLMRFVLASPDIPAETLLSDRANFLASSLRRFREAYLFSSEGDEVLRMISTAANYFSFPTKKRNFGYRLGNAEILSRRFGAVPVQGELLRHLRAGRQTLAALSERTRQKSRDRAQVASAFTYFDCTDYVDGPNRRGLLTDARHYKKDHYAGRIPCWGHVLLLLQYLTGRIDVHGGYFDGALTQKLIYFLAGLGFDRTAAAFGGEDEMLKECADKQIRVILSDRLGASRFRLRDEREEMETPEGKNAELMGLRDEIDRLKSGLELRGMADALADPPAPDAIKSEDGFVWIEGVRTPKRED